MNKVILIVGALLGFAPARTEPLTPPTNRADFEEPACLAATSDQKLRLKCYRATLQKHPHYWGVDQDQPILDWHANNAWEIYMESASYVAAKEGSYTRTEISQYMYLASLVIMTDVYAKFYRSDPRVKKICVAADAALKLAWQKTYCANAEDEPAASAVPGSSRDDAAARYRDACGKELPDSGAAPINCKGVGETRQAMSALANVLLDKEREVMELTALAPEGQFQAPRDELSSWRTELVELTTALEQEIAAGTLDATQQAARIKEYQAKIELPGVVAVEEAKVDAVQNVYQALDMKPPSNVSKSQSLVAKPPSPQELCERGATSCVKFEGALKGYYGKLERQERKAPNRWRDAFTSANEAAGKSR